MKGGENRKMRSCYKCVHYCICEYYERLSENRDILKIIPTEIVKIEMQTFKFEK